MSLFTIAGGKIICRQCHAKSKRTKIQCQAPAMKGKEVCRFHGGLSQGPTTAEGRMRCAVAKTIHGKETRKSREEIRAKLIQLAAIEAIGRSIGMFAVPMRRGTSKKNR